MVALFSVSVVAVGLVKSVWLVWLVWLVWVLKSLFGEILLRKAYTFVTALFNFMLPPCKIYMRKYLFAVARVSGGSHYCGASFGWCLAGGFLAWLCDIGITCLAALRSYTLLRLIGCIVKFSFLLTFSAEVVIYQKGITIVPLLYCSTKQFLSPTTSKTASVLWYGKSAWHDVCSSTDASVL